MDRPHVDGLLRCGVYGVDDALLLAGVAASAAGTGMGVAASAQDRSAMNNVRTIEARRQQDLQDQANGVFQKSLSASGADTAKKQTASGAAQRQSVYNALKQVAQPGTAAPATAADSPDAVVNTDNPTQTANSLATTRGNAWSTLTSGAASREGGYQDYDTDQALKNAEANRNLGVIGNRAAGWARIFPTELEVASHKGDALAGWGQLVSALGSVAGIGGAMGAGLGSAGDGAPTAAQGAALDAGMGPVSAGYATTIAPQVATVNTARAFSPWGNVDWATGL